MQRCPSCGEENSERARFCQACATPLTQAEPAGETRKVVTVVFSDLSGSTALGERLDPEALRRVMERYFDRMSAVIDRHGGTVEKFIGDAVMAVFGIPRLHEDDAIRAVRAAADMVDALEELNVDIERDHGVRIQARIGVNTGEVVAGDPGAGQRLVTGDTVNTAARLEQAAPAGHVLLGASTYQLVRDAVDVDPVEPLTLKGKAEPVPAYRLVTVRATGEGHNRHLDSPMVGREKELEVLSRALERTATERTSYLFTVLGPAGVGKSRLTQEFLSGPAAGATMLFGRCLSYGEGITFYPLSEMVQRAAAIAEADELPTIRKKLRDVLGGSDDPERTAVLVGGLLGWDPPASDEEAFWGVRKLFEHLAVGRPLVLVFDDLHWAEPTFLDLVEYLADWTRDSSILLLCVARPELLELRPGWGGGKLNATTILLEPLDGEACSRLIDNVLGRSNLPDAARARILEAAEGNPLFVEEMLGMLIDDGLLRLEDGEWHAAADLASIAIPPTIQLLLAARLDRLDGEERAVIERGAVEGKVFHTGAVASLTPESSRQRVPSRLLALARKELIRPDRAEFAGEDAFRFRHLLIRDAAYQAMPKEQRADLHERFAGWLEQAAGERLAEYEEILGFHLEQAYLFRQELGPTDPRTDEIGRKAAFLLRSSAERAFARGDASSAQAVLRRATDLVRGIERLEPMIQLARAHSILANFPEEGRLAGEIGALAEEEGDRRGILVARLFELDVAGQMDPTLTQAAAEREVKRIAVELGSVGNEGDRIQALMMLGRLAFYRGSCAGARGISERVLAQNPTLTPVQRESVAWSFFSDAYFGSVPVSQAWALVDQARGSFGESRFGDALISNLVGSLRAYEGRFDEARAKFSDGRAIWQELGDPLRGLTAGQIYGEVEWLAGDLEAAERLFRESHEGFTAMGETGFNSTMVSLLANVVALQGRLDEAERYARLGLELGADDDFATLVQATKALALVASGRGEHEDAIRLAREAVATAGRTDYLSMTGECHEVLGRVLAAADRLEEARSALSESLACFERKESVPAIARVRAELEALSGD